MQFAVQASVQGMRLLPGPVSTLRHHVASGASAQLGAGRVGAPGVRSALASPFLAPGLGPLQVPAKPSLRSGGRVELGSARAEAQVGVGAYNRDSFVSETEANKIAQIRLPSLGFCNDIASCLKAIPLTVSFGDFQGEKSSTVHRVVLNFMNQSGSGSVENAYQDGMRSFLRQTTSLVSNSTHGLGVPKGLWGPRAGMVSQLGSSIWGAGNRQVRNVMVEVSNDDLERAIRKMKRRLKDDNGIKLLRERQYFRKPSDLKVLARKERDKRIAKKTFRAKLKWITARQARGF